MIILDTHVWVWWVHGDPRLTPSQLDALQANESGTIGLSAISCWEIARLVELGRLVLPRSLTEWFVLALAYPGVRLIALDPDIAVASTRLGDGFHRDPADQLIVATAQIRDCPLVTSDTRILNFPHVETIA